MNKQKGNAPGVLTMGWIGQLKNGIVLCVILIFLHLAVFFRFLLFLFRFIVVNIVKMLVVPFFGSLAMILRNKKRDLVWKVEIFYRK